MHQAHSAVVPDLSTLRRNVHIAKRDLMTVLSRHRIGPAFEVDVATKASLFASAVRQYRKALFAEGCCTLSRAS